MFEGTEKKLDITLNLESSLRECSRVFWENILSRCGAEILSRQSHHAFDAYILSESSLFVFDNRIVIITCGQTNLTLSARELISQLGSQNIEHLFYGHKQFAAPDAQPITFDQEVEEFQKIMPVASYRLGEAGQQQLQFLVAKTPRQAVSRPGKCLEVLMSDLDRNVLAQMQQPSLSSDEYFRLSAIPELLSEKNSLTYRDHVFTPWGYSLNGASGDGYLTCHLTPEDIGSFASFETTIDPENLNDFIRKLLDHYRPKQTLIIEHGQSFGNYAIGSPFKIMETSQLEWNGSAIKVSTLGFEEESHDRSTNPLSSGTRRQVDQHQLPRYSNAL